MSSVAATGSVTSTQSNAGTTSTSQSGTVNYNEFLQLLIAEMKDQDPTSPADPTQYMSQLASFSEVEQSTQTNSILKSVLSSSSLSQAENAIGRLVTSADGKTTGTVDSVTINTDGSATAQLSNGQTLTLGSGVTIGVAS